MNALSLQVAWTLELYRFQNALSDADDGKEFAADVGSGFSKLHNKLFALVRGE